MGVYFNRFYQGIDYSQNHVVANDVYNEDRIIKCQVYFEVRNLPVSRNTIRLLEEQIVELRDQKSCGLFDNWWEQQNIDDDIIMAEMAIEYIDIIACPLVDFDRYTDVGVAYR